VRHTNEWLYGKLYGYELGATPSPGQPAVAHRRRHRIRWRPWPWPERKRLALGFEPVVIAAVPGGERLQLRTASLHAAGRQANFRPR